MPVLHDAAGGQAWITITEENGTRFLYLDGCEEGAMLLDGETPVFNYLWFHKLSRLVTHRQRRILVLGAGAFTAPKCLALNYPCADIHAVDVEPQLGVLAQRFFRLDRPEFARIHFHGVAAEQFLSQRPAPFDFIFDDLFDGYQHVPLTGRGGAHARQLRTVLSEGGVCVKNLIWDPSSVDTQAACDEAATAWRETFAGFALFALGSPNRGHNRLLVGGRETQSFDWETVRAHLLLAGAPTNLLEHVTPFAR